jgi:hypothetical protein
MQNYYYDERVTNSLKKSKILMDIFTFIKEIEGSNNLWEYYIISKDIFTKSKHNNTQIIKLLELINSTKCKKSYFQFIFRNNFQILPHNILEATPERCNNCPPLLPQTFKPTLKKRIIKQLNDIVFMFISKKSKRKLLEELFCLYAMYTIRFQIENQNEYDYIDFNISENLQSSSITNNFAGPNLQLNLQNSNQNHLIENGRRKVAVDEIVKVVNLPEEAQYSNLDNNYIELESYPQLFKKRYAEDYVMSIKSKERWDLNALQSSQTILNRSNSPKSLSLSSEYVNMSSPRSSRVATLRPNSDCVNTGSNSDYVNTGPNRSYYINKLSKSY